MYQPVHVFLGGDAKLSSPFSSIGLELSKSPSFEVSAESLPNEFALGPVLLFCSFFSLFSEPWREGYRPSYGGTQKNHLFLLSITKQDIIWNDTFKLPPELRESLMLSATMGVSFH